MVSAGRVSTTSASAQHTSIIHGSELLSLLADRRSGTGVWVVVMMMMRVVVASRWRAVPAIGRVPLVSVGKHVGLLGLCRVDGSKTAGCLLLLLLLLLVELKLVYVRSVVEFAGGPVVVVCLPVLTAPARAGVRGCAG
jgi:hypothetical protein